MKVKSLEKMLIASKHMYDCGEYRNMELENIVMFEDQLMLRTSFENKEVTITIKNLEEKTND